MAEHLKIVYRDSTKGKKYLILESYVYYIKKENQDSIRYTCKNCNASVTIENETDLILKINGNNLRNQINIIDMKQKLIESHNSEIVHELITEEDLVVIDSMSRLKEKVQNEAVPVQQIFQEEQSICKEKWTVRKCSFKFSTIS